jgi:hypothetical protein
MQEDKKALKIKINNLQQENKIDKIWDEDVPLAHGA